MRITNNLLIHNMLWNMNNNLVSMNEKQTQLATGKKIHKPSDDPVGTTRVIKVKSDIVENLQYKDNVRDAKSWLDVSENSLMDTKDILQRVRELAVQGANDTYTAAETANIAQEIDQLIEELIVNANSTLAGRYLFSGFQTDKPLLNKDGTYNIDVTSDKTTNFESIAYEVAVGEYLPVGTNYLDVYGIVAADNTIIDSFLFGNANGDESQMVETTGDAATHSKVQFPFDYKTDLTAATTKIIVDGVTFTLDATKLDGTITQEEFTEILLNAEQTNPAPPIPPAITPTLNDVAGAYFVESDNPANVNGELVIELKGFGAKVINASSMGTLTYDIALPTLISGVSSVKPVHAKLEGYFDYGTNLVSETLAFVVGGTTYEVDVKEFDGTLTEEEFIELIDNAKDSTGKLLKDSMNVNFDKTAGTRGVLTIETKVATTASLVLKDSGNGFTIYPKRTSGQDGDHGKKATIRGTINLINDISASAPGDLSFTINNVTYKVDTATMNGGLSAVQVRTLMKNASDGNGGILDDVADVNFTNVLPPLYDLVIQARKSENDSPTAVDNSLLFTTAIVLRDGEEADENVLGIKARLEGPVDLNKVMTALPAGGLTFTMDGETYTVDTTKLTGSLSPDEFLEEIEKASNGSGGKLSDVAYVWFDNNENPYELVIESKNPISDAPAGVDTNGLFETGTTIVNGVAKVEGVNAKVAGALDLSKDNTAGVLSYTIDGMTFTVDKSTMIAGLSAGDAKLLIENANDGSPFPGVKLSTKATVNINTTVNPYEFVIESIVPTNDEIVVVDSGNIYVKNPYTLGVKTVEPIKASIVGTFNYGIDISASALTYEVDGKTYTPDLSTMNGTLTESEFLEVIKNATDGSGGKLSDLMNVSFDPTTGTLGKLTIEQKLGGDAVVNSAGAAKTLAYVGLVTEIDGVDGVINTKAIVTGTGKITDEMLSDPITGIGTQSFVVTYNDETTRIDVDLTDVNTMAEMKTVLDKELNTAFGDDGGSPPINNVTFDIVFDGSNDVVQFTGSAKDDGSQTYLKVDIVKSSKPQLIQDLEDFSKALTNKDNEGINKFLGKIDDQMDNVISVIANIGAKTNRLEFIKNRIDDNNISLTEILSKVQDVDYAKVTIQFKSLESIYRASLSVGAKVIQPTLVDFIK